jgi:hypothetical protein
MSKGGSGTQQPAGQTTSTQVSAPWSGQQPYLLQGFNQAQNLFNQGGPQYYPGQTYAGPTDAQLAGITAEANIGQGGTAAQNAATPALQNMLGRGWLYGNPAESMYSGAAQGGLNVNTGGYFSPLASGQQTNTMGVPGLSNIASGANLNTAGQPTLNAMASGAIQNTAGLPTLNQFASGADLSANNPYFQNMANSVTQQVLPAIQSEFNAGNRLDSGLGNLAASQGLGSAIGNLAYQNYQQGLQQQQQAATTMGEFGAQNISNMLGAAGTLGQLGASNLGAQLSAGGELANIGQGNIGNQLAASTALTNLGLGNVGTQLAGMQGFGGLYGQAAQQQMQALGLSPAIGQMQYQQAGALQDAGSTLQGLNQSAITDAMNRWNFGQQQPYQNLQNYMQNIQGNYGSNTTASQPYYSNSLANTLGGALGGSALANSMFGGNNSNSGGGIGSTLSGLYNSIFGGGSGPSYGSSSYAPFWSSIGNVANF